MKIINLLARKNYINIQWFTKKFYNKNILSTTWMEITLYKKKKKKKKKDHQIKWKKNFILWN